MLSTVVYVQAHADDWKAVLAANLLHEPYAEPNRLVSMPASDHHRVADAFDQLGAVLGQQRSHRVDELPDQVGCLLVAADLGEGREPREVREEECLLAHGWGRVNRTYASAAREAADRISFVHVPLRTSCASLLSCIRCVGIQQAEGDLVGADVRR